MPFTRTIAVVHDFLYTYAGGERVLEQILRLYPEADLFSLFDFVPPEQRGFLQGKVSHTTFLQRLPLVRKKHRMFLPLMPLAIEQLNLSGYDLILSSSHLAAKGVLTGPNQLHICYCHSPVRFAWDMQEQYLSESGLNRGLRAMLARALLHYVRLWDVQSANRVDQYIANSNFIAARIRKTYRREATTIYPPVDVENFACSTHKEDYYLTASRLVPYKRIDVIVEAFRRMPRRRLVVIGEGPQSKRLQTKSAGNVQFMGYQPFNVLRDKMSRAKAFIFAAEEDFGIVPVEAQACGTPVIAFGRGGVTESIVAGETGLFFDQQTPESLMAAVESFENCGARWDVSEIRANSERFSVARFCQEYRDFVETRWDAFCSKRNVMAAEVQETIR